ncbi:MAG: hypothetical protein IT380_25530 [Myxococcales bacterium]|nr:hypothetical protein [Myxococcales bacterium]
MNSPTPANSPTSEPDVFTAASDEKASQVKESAASPVIRSASPCVTARLPAPATS